MKHNWVFTGTETLWMRVLVSKGVPSHVWNLIIATSIDKADILTQEKYGCPYDAKREIK